MSAPEGFQGYLGIRANTFGIDRAKNDGGLGHRFSLGTQPRYVHHNVSPDDVDLSKSFDMPRNEFC
jgi:hypothetical protein